MARRLTDQEKQEIKKLTPKEAFSRWIKTNPNSKDTPQSLMSRLWDQFGGDKYEGYKKWAASA